MKTPDEITTEEVVYDPYTEKYYKAYGSFGGTPVHVHRGSCVAEIEDDDGTHECGDRAAVRRINEDGIEDYCKTHAPEGWLKSLEEHNQLDNTLVNLRATCEKWVSGTYDHDTVPVQERNGGDHSGVHQCGDQALLTVALQDREAKSFCRRHIRNDWLRDVEIETGLPEALWDEEEKGEEYVLVDLKRGIEYECYDDWENGSKGEYPDIMEAERHVAAYKADEAEVRGEIKWSSE